jgi:hypothetical protein
MGELPPQPDEVTLEELLELARRLEAHPENRPGSDKTWVLHGLRRFQHFWREYAEHGFRTEDGPQSSRAARRAAGEKLPPT